MLYIYDDAMLNLISTMKWNGKTPPIVIAKPGREFTSVDEFFEKNYGIKKSDLAGFRTYPRPFITITRQDIEVDSTRFSPTEITVQKDIESMVGWVARSPSSQRFVFLVNFYFSNENQMDYFLVQIKNLWANKVAWVNVDFSDGKYYHNENKVFEYAKYLGEQIINVFQDSLNNSSVYEQSGLEDRDIKMTMNCSMWAVIPHQPEKRMLVQDVNFMVTHDEES